MKKYIILKLHPLTEDEIYVRRSHRSLPHCKGLDREGLGDACKALEMDLARRRIVESDLIDWRPQHELLGLHSFELLDPLLLHEARYTRIIAHLLADHLEIMLHFLLLLDPHVSSAPHESNFDHISQWEQPTWQLELFKKGYGQFQPFFMPLLYYSSFLFRHCWTCLLGWWSSSVAPCSLY